MNNITVTIADKKIYVYTPIISIVAIAASYRLYNCMFIVTPTEKEKKVIKRTGSEFSLGLSRNSSFIDNINELGELCNTGRYAVYVLKGTFLLTVTTIGTFIIYKRLSMKR